jgi:hypothetical protein
MSPDASQLSQLRDIHLPSAVSIWPLAPVWWLLLALLLLLGGVGYFLLRRHRAARWRRDALGALLQLRHDGTDDAENNAQLRLSGLSVLLRQVALARFPRQQVAALHGDAWLDFLQGPGGEPGQGPKKGAAGAALPIALRPLLAMGPYQNPNRNPGGIAAGDVDALFAWAGAWIKRLPREVAR